MKKKQAKKERDEEVGGSYKILKRMEEHRGDGYETREKERTVFIMSEGGFVLMEEKFLQMEEKPYFIKL